MSFGASSTSFNEEDFPEAAVREGADELTLRRENAEGTTAGGRGLTRSLPSHLQGRRGKGMGKHVQQVRGDAQSGELSETSDQQEGKDAHMSELPTQRSFDSIATTKR